MAYWAETHILYKIGIIGIVVTFVIFVVGFSTPVWYRSSPPATEQGLWQFCEESFINCKYLETHKVVVIRGIEIAALAFHLSATINAFIGFFSSRTNPLSIVILGILAGVFGIVGEILYGTWGIADQNPTNSTSNHLSWSFSLAVIASGLLVMFSVLAFVVVRYFEHPGRDDSDISEQDARESARNQSAPKHQYQNPYYHHHPYSGDKIPMQDVPRYQSGYRSPYKPGYDPDQHVYYGGNQRRMYQSSQRYGYDQRY